MRGATQMKLRKILENLCDEDDENVRCTMLDQAEQEILKLLLSWKDIDKELYLLFNFEPELRKSIAKTISNKMKEKL